MISQEELDGIVRRWAVAESFERGYECEPRLDEFDKGWVVWAPYPVDQQGDMTPGSGLTHIIDRESGEITVIPGVPPVIARQIYQPRPSSQTPPQDPAVSLAERQRRAALTEAEVVRYTNGQPYRLPQIAAELTVGDRVFTAVGHIADTTPGHHPLVWQVMSSLAPGNRNRGAERHAELIALSQALFAWFGQNPADLDQVRSLLSTARLQLKAFAEGSDPYADNRAYSCHTVRSVFVALGMPGSAPPDLVAPPLPPRQTGDLSFVRGRVTTALVQAAVVPGLRHQLPVLPFLPEILAPYGSVYGVLQSGPGTAQRAEGFTLTAALSRPVADTLGDASVQIGAKLFPIGEEGVGLTSILAIDERQRVFAIDQVGVWYIGANLDAAVQTLLTGAATPRVRADGTFS